MMVETLTNVELHAIEVMQGNGGLVMVKLSVCLRFHRISSTSCGMHCIRQTLGPRSSTGHQEK